MQTAVINIKVEPKTKREAQRVAEEIGISLSGLINGFLKHLIRTRTVTFSATEEPSKYLIQALKEAEKEIKMGWVSPTFDNIEGALAWLDNPKRKYVNQLRKKVQ